MAFVFESFKLVYVFLLFLLLGVSLFFALGAEVYVGHFLTVELVDFLLHVDVSDFGSSLRVEHLEIRFLGLKCFLGLE